MPVRLQAVNVETTIEQQVATTTIAFSLLNPAGQPQEAQLVIPVPDGIAVRGLQYDGTGPEPTATILPRDEARRMYNSIVNASRDPALLEFAGYNLIKTSVFPVPAGSSQVVRVTYEQLLPADGDRIDYVLPRSESLIATDVGWTFSASIKSKRPIATVYSPSHNIAVDRVSDHEMRVKASGSAASDPGSYRLSLLLRKESGLSATVMAYPDHESPDGKGGYLLLLASMPEVPPEAEPQKRELVIVIDRSGSMRGPKMEQARAAASQVIEGLAEGEAFNIIDYSDSIASFAEKPVIKTRESMAAAREYIKKIQAGGGTNIHDSVLEALRPRPMDGMLPIVLFLTDGLPTVGERSEVAIREAVKKANTAERRIFSFGVGLDVNAPLLTSIARTGRGTSTFVLPDEDVEVKVSQVYRRLSGPILAAPKLTVLDRSGEVTTRLIRDLQPGVIPDVFDGDQFMLLARYEGDQPMRLKVDGAFLGKPRSFEFTFDPSTATARNGFVPRLWATRKIASLIDEVRSMGAAGANAASDPRFKELTDEIVRLSTRYGVLTEYTAFLAIEPGARTAGLHIRGGRGTYDGRIAAPAAEAPARAADELAKKALTQRGGAGGIAQDLSNNAYRSSTNAQYANKWVDSDMKETRATGVQAANSSVALFRGDKWVEPALLAQESEPPEVTIEFGTPEFDTVLTQLILENRQGLLARGGKVYLLVQNKRTLVNCPD